MAEEKLKFAPHLLEAVNDFKEIPQSMLEKVKSKLRFHSPMNHVPWT